MLPRFLDAARHDLPLNALIRNILCPRERRRMVNVQRWFAPPEFLSLFRGFLKLCLGANLHRLWVRRSAHQRADARMARAVRGTTVDRRKSRREPQPGSLCAALASGAPRGDGRQRVFSRHGRKPADRSRALFHPATSDRPIQNGSLTRRVSRRAKPQGARAAWIILPSLRRFQHMTASRPPKFIAAVTAQNGAVKPRSR